MDHLADELGVTPVPVAGLQRDIRAHDFRALFALRRTIRKVRPTIVHTHLAKAGALSRIASVLSGRARPRVVVHTFHGHVFEGVFVSRIKPKLFVRIERILARFTTCFIAVSEEVRDDLVRYRIAPREKIEVVRLGFDLSRFKLDATRRGELRRAFRQELGIPLDASVVTVVARVVQMKRIDRFLRVAQEVSALPNVFFLIVGDGDQRAALEASETSRTLGARVVWTGIRHDLPAVYAASDIVVLTSDNEGTPVAFIEAQAAGIPVVGTKVAGVPTVVDHGRTGFLLPRDDEAGLARAIRELLENTLQAQEFGAAGQEHVFQKFSVERLVAEIDELYRRLLSRSGL